MTDDGEPPNNTDRQKERRVEHLIRRSLAQIDIAIAEDVHWPVSYDSDDGVAVVVLPAIDEGWSVSKLRALYDSGLSDDYMIAANTVHHLELRFKLRPEILP